MVSLKKNFVYSILYQILTIILPLITAPYVSRVLGADGIGEYSFTQSVAAYFGLMAMLGISQHGNRSISECGQDVTKRSRIFWHIYFIQFVTHIIAIFIYVLYVLKFHNDILSWLQLIYIVSSMFDISWLFFGMEKFDVTVMRNVIIKITTVVLIFAFVKEAGDLWKYTLILVVGTWISQAYLWLFLYKYIQRTKFDANILKAQILPTIILFIPVLAYSIYKVMDKIMLGALSTYGQVGLYENAYKINNIPTGFITAIGNVMLPRATSLISKGEHQLVKKYTEKTFFIINAFSCALVFGIAGISSNFAIVYYGEEFAQSGTLMVCLNWTVFFVAWANVMRTQFLIPNKRDKIYVISTISGAVANLMINMALIGRYGAYGAAIGTFFAEFIVMFVQAIYIRKELPIFKYIFSSWRYFVAGIIMMIVVRGVGKVGGIGLKTLIIQVFVGALIYLICALTISYRKKDEIWNSIILQIYTKIKRGRKKKC